MLVCQGPHFHFELHILELGLPDDTASIGQGLKKKSEWGSGHALGPGRQVKGRDSDILRLTGSVGFPCPGSYADSRG